MAEYYHVLDYRSLPLRLLATLAAGLPHSSRSFLNIAGESTTLDTKLLAGVLDSLHLIIWQLSGARGRRPDFVLDALNDKHGDVQAYDDAESFEAALREIKGG